MTITPKDNGKTPAKPISLYPMSEEEAVRRLLRVPPPDKSRSTEGEWGMSKAQPASRQTATNGKPKQAISVGAPMTLTITVTGNKQTHTEIRETKSSLR